MEALIKFGFEVFPVNPNYAGKKILGKECYPNLKAINKKIDMVDIFRKPSDVGPIVQDSIRELNQIKTIWMQLKVVNEDAANIANDAGLNVVMDRCPKIEFR